jgi:hypothetical protein
VQRGPPNEETAVGEKLVLSDEERFCSCERYVYMEWKFGTQVKHVPCIWACFMNHLIFVALIVTSIMNGGFGQGHTKETSIAMQPQFPRIVISMS